MHVNDLNAFGILSGAYYTIKAMMMMKIEQTDRLRERENRAREEILEHIELTVYVHVHEHTRTQADFTLSLAPSNGEYILSK